MTTTPTDLSTHEHGEEAVEIVVQEMRRRNSAASDADRYGAARDYVAALSSAGFLATGQEWGVAFDPGNQYVKTTTSRAEAERQVTEHREWSPQHAHLASRGVTAWREA